MRHARPAHLDESGSVALKVVGVIVAVFLVFALIFIAIGNFAEETLPDEAQSVTDVREGAITPETFEAVEIGADKEDLLADLRPALPVEGRVLDRYQERSPQTVASSCVYYDGTNLPTEEMYRFCFEEDVLVDKTVVFPNPEPLGG